ncbi:glutathione S-transferase T3-like [Helianthus annuus]|uniref:glutathione S-transferase T3-like n=1 Tax=Helianthus annuus TaxID=4232 RepID=UPI001652F0C0|nr:glutathione S-transferase T3-like [Helianthus annuus]
MGQAQFESQPPTSPVRLVDDEEVVPIRHLKISSAKKNKGKAVETVVETKGDSKPKARPWTKLEEEALAMAWVKSSTCPIIGNNQTGSGFWKVIMEKFNAIMEQGPMRDVDSVSGKWRKMIKVINRFSGIYNQYYTNPPSGNEEDILNLALAKWDDKNTTPFQHLRAWNVLKKENKWKPIPNEVFAVHESGRPPGRDKAKKEAVEKRKAGGSNQPSSGAVSKMDELISKFRSFKELTTEKYSYMKNLSADHARAEDFRIMRLDLDSVPEDEREVYRRMKEKVKKKWAS